LLAATHQLPFAWNHHPAPTNTLTGSPRFFHAIGHPETKLKVMRQWIRDHETARTGAMP
jgi:hypothetical protein